MLSERPRNIFVGLTMLVSLGVLMYGIILLGKFPAIGTGYLITLNASAANGVAPGNAVLLNGVDVGQVKSVALYVDPAGKVGAHIVIQIDNTYNLPETTQVVLARPQTVGNTYVSLEVSEIKGKLLPHDGSAVLNAEIGESSLIPKEVFADLKNVFADVHDFKDELSGLSRELTSVAKDLHVLLVYTPPEAVEGANPNDPNRVRENASTVIIRLNRVVKSMQDLLGDPALQGKVRDAVQNISEASTQLKKTLEKIDIAADKVGGNLDSVGAAATQAGTALQAVQKEVARVSQTLVESLVEFQNLTRQIREGNGTTGRLINDPRLYDGMLDLSKSLKKTVDDLDFLLSKWKDEGVNLHVK